MHRLFFSIGLAAIILVLAMPSTYYFASAQQEEEDQIETDTGGPSVRDTSLDMEQVGDGLDSPTTMAFLDEDRIYLYLKRTMARSG